MARNKNHDYRSVCIYHITINKSQDIREFSSVIGSPEKYTLSYSSIGLTIFSVIKSLKDINNDIYVLQHSIMPDHLHMLLHVKAYLDKPLGVYISMFKIRILQLLRDKGICNGSVFEKDFHDRILRPWHSLDAVYQYVKDNPRRLLVRRFFPEYFRKINYLFDYKDIRWKAYGNMQLFDNPFKECVVCHRSDTESRRLSNIYNWMHVVSNGGVLVSPFISKAEKDMRNYADSVDGNIILITNKAFGDRYKPSGHDFKCCERGHLLIISPYETLPDCRQTYLLMNEIAAWISGGL